MIDRRAANPTIQFSLLRHENFLAANISQFLAGMVELGLGGLQPPLALDLRRPGPLAGDRQASSALIGD